MPAHQSKTRGNRWKLTAIVLIGVCVIETLLLIFFFALLAIGADVTEKETECSASVCGEAGYPSFYYDGVEKVCYCYDSDGAIVKQQVMG